RAKLGWTSAAFEVPGDVRDLWLAAGKRSQRAHAEWKQRLAALDRGPRSGFERRQRGGLPTNPPPAGVRARQGKRAAQPQAIAHRVASEFALDALLAAAPEMVGGSADLTGSNNTKVKGMTVFSAAQPAGRFIHYGVREHGMAAAMNGMALHRRVIP